MQNQNRHSKGHAKKGSGKISKQVGLRVGEVARLKVEDIDTERKLIHVRGAKGRKDRYTILSDVAIETLNLYLKSYQPKKWLFHGKNENSHLTVRSVEKIFDNAVRKWGGFKVYEGVI